MEIAFPGEFPVYQRLFGPLATQHGALVGYGGVGPAIGFTLPFASAMAKLSGLCAGVNPRTFPQKAAPSGVLLASSGRAMLFIVPFSAPSSLSGNCRTDPEVIVTAAHV